MKPSHLIALLLLGCVFATPVLAAPAQPTQLAPFAAFAAPSRLIPKVPHISRPAPPDSGTYTIIDDPNAGNGYGQGTFPYAINSSGSV